MQGRATPEIKKELHNKKEAKANPPPGMAAGGGGAGGAGASGGAGAQKDAAAPKAEAATSTAPAGAGPVGAGDGAPPKPGAHTGDDVDHHNVERLIEMLDHDADPEHRRAAARALGKIHSPKARAALEKAARDKDPMVAKAATESLAGAMR